MCKLRRLRAGKMETCFCGRDFKDADSLYRHQQRIGCGGLVKQQEAEEQAAAATRAVNHRILEVEEVASKRARREEYADSMRHTVALRLAHYRFYDVTAGTTVDSFKADFCNWIADAIRCIAEDFTKKISNDSERDDLLDCCRSRFDFFKGIETERKEITFLKTILPIADPIERVMKTTTTIDAEGMQPLVPSVRKQLKCVDFKIDDRIALLIEHDQSARQQIHDTIIEWSAKPPEIPREKKIYVDITDGSVFLNHPVLGMQARVSREEAVRAAPDAPLKMAFMLYTDAFTAREPFPSPSHVASYPHVASHPVAQQIPPP